MGSRPAAPRTGVVALAALIATGHVATRAAEPSARVTLLPAGSRASVVVELDADVSTATTIEGTDHRTVTVAIGPIHQKVANQLLQAAERAPLVSQVRLRSMSRNADSTVVTVHVTAKQPVVGTVRRSTRRVYIDLVPRDVAPPRAVQAPSRVWAERAPDPPPPPVTRTLPVPEAKPAITEAGAAAGVTSRSASSKAGTGSVDIETHAARLAKAADVRGLEALKRDVEARSDTAAAADAAALDATLLRLDDFIQEAQRNRLAADAALLKQHADSASTGSAARTPATSRSSATTPPVRISDEQAISEFRGFRTDLERIAQAANLWTGGRPPSALVTLSAMLPRLRAQHAPAKIARAHANLCAALDQLALIWASASADPPPEGSDPPAMEGARVALEQFLTLERSLNNAPGTP